MSGLTSHFRMLGHYNAWANARLYDAEFVQQLAPALAHWFNHQTHHRGQVHALWTGLGQPATGLDLLFFQRELAKSASSA